MSVAVRNKRPAVKGAGKTKKKPRSLKESREDWLRRLRAEYTPEVCAQTLAVHESLPIDGEP